MPAPPPVGARRFMYGQRGARSQSKGWLIKAVRDQGFVARDQEAHSMDIARSVADTSRWKSEMVTCANRMQRVGGPTKQPESPIRQSGRLSRGPVEQPVLGVSGSRVLNLKS